MKYFPVNIEINEKVINYYLPIIEEIKAAFSERFDQMPQLETSLQFIGFLQKIEL